MSARVASPTRPRQPRRVRADLRFLSIWVFTVPTVMSSRPDATWALLDGSPRELLGRLESQLEGEAKRYRAVYVAIVAFLLLAAFLAYAWAILHTSRQETRRMAVDLTRLADVAPEGRKAVVAEAAGGGLTRAEFVLRKAKPFSEYRGLLTPGGKA